MLIKMKLTFAVFGDTFFCVAYKSTYNFTDMLKTSMCNVRKKLEIFETYKHLFRFLKNTEYHGARKPNCRSFVLLHQVSRWVSFGVRYY